MKKSTKKGTVKRRRREVHGRENSFTGLIEKFRNSVSNLMNSRLRQEDDSGGNSDWKSRHYILSWDFSLFYLLLQ